MGRAASMTDHPGRDSNVAMKDLPKDSLIVCVDIGTTAGGVWQRRGVLPALR
jgi:hypothetical protein